MHAGCPWREVVHIDTVLGSHGGQAWKLTLVCGHWAFRSNPVLDAGRVFRIRRIRFAPKRVRCWHCGNPPTQQETHGAA